MPRPLHHLLLIDPCIHYTGISVTSAPHLTYIYFSQRVGVTATLPDEVPDYLPLSDTGPQEWYYDCTALWHNGRELCSDIPNLWDLRPHQRVGLLLTTSGDLHVFLDGRHVKKVASWAQRVSAHSQWVQ